MPIRPARKRVSPTNTASLKGNVSVRLGNVMYFLSSVFGLGVGVAALAIWIENNAADTDKVVHVRAIEIFHACMGQS